MTTRKPSHANEGLLPHTVGYNEFLQEMMGVQ